MLIRLFKRNLKKNQETKQEVEHSESVKEPTLTERLGLPFGINEIEYISIIHQDLDDPIYYIAISNSENLKILTHTYSNSKDQIIARLEDLKSYFKPFGNYVNLGESLPLINLNRIKSTNLIYDEPDENNQKRNHTVIYLTNGKTYHTEIEISDSRKLNFSEFVHYTFWSNHNERLYGK